jgi:hypothetical protein
MTLDLFHDTRHRQLRRKSAAAASDVAAAVVRDNSANRSAMNTNVTHLLDVIVATCYVTTGLSERRKTNTFSDNKTPTTKANKQIRVLS